MQRWQHAAPPVWFGDEHAVPFRSRSNCRPNARRCAGEVRAFIADELAAGRWTPNSDFGSHRAADFSRRLGERGWIGMTWPKRYGGGERSFLERYVVTEEMLAAGAPVGAHWIADRQSGPLLLRFGTEEQRETFLPGICRGEIFFAIGMSEPDSGSDLASIRTRATPVGGGYEVTGAKVWTSYAHESHYAITLVRTDALDPKNRHAGLSQLIVDLKAPGVTIRPILNLAGEHDFNEIVLDRVFVPSERLVGGEGDGWRQVTSELAFERSGPGAVSVARIQVLVGLVERAGDDPEPALAEALGRIGANLWTLRQMSLSVAGMLQAGETPNLEAALVKDLGNAFEPASRSGRARYPAARRQRPTGDRLEAALADGPARAVLDLARRHARDPARHHRPRPRAALSESAMRDTILYDSALRLFGDHVTPRCWKRPRPASGRRRCGGRWTRPAISTCWPTVPAAWSRRSRSCAPPGITPRRSRCPRRCWRAGCAPLSGIEAPAGPLVDRAGGTRMTPDAIRAGAHGAARRRRSLSVSDDRRSVSPAASSELPRFEPGTSLAGEPRDLLDRDRRGRARRRCRMRSRPIWCAASAR